MIYFFYGEDSFSLSNHVSGLKQKFIEQVGETGIEEINIDGNTSEAGLLDRLREAWYGQGLFAEKKFIILRDFVHQAKKYPKVTELLLRILEKETKSENQLVLLQEEKVDKRLAFYKKLIKLAAAKEFVLPTGSDLEAWVRQRLKEEGFKLDGQALRVLTSLLTGGADEPIYDLWQVEAELQKLILFKWQEKTIESADVLAVVSENVAENVFQLTNLFAEGNSRGALKALEKMLQTARSSDLKQKTIQIIGALAAQLRSLLLVKSIEGKQPAEIAKILGWKEGRVWINLKLSKKFTEIKLKNLLYDLAAIDRRLKSSEESPKLLLSLFVQKAKV